MRIAPIFVNAFVDDLAEKMAGGTLDLYDGEPPSGVDVKPPEFQEPLMSLPFPAKLQSASAGMTEATLSGAALRSGEPRWGRISSADGPIADVVVRWDDEVDASDVDIRLRRVDKDLNEIRRGDVAEVTIRLRLPQLKF